MTLRERLSVLPLRERFDARHTHTSRLILFSSNVSVFRSRLELDLILNVLVKAVNNSIRIAIYVSLLQFSSFFHYE